MSFSCIAASTKANTSSSTIGLFSSLSSSSRPKSSRPSIHKSLFARSSRVKLLKFIKLSGNSSKKDKLIWRSPTFQIRLMNSNFSWKIRLTHIMKFQAILLGVKLIQKEAKLTLKLVRLRTPVFFRKLMDKKEKVWCPMKIYLIFYITITTRAKVGAKI